jgi:DNA-binding CsgD family transcriptional regulator
MTITSRRIDAAHRLALLDLLAAAVQVTTVRARLELLVDGFVDLLDGEIGGFNCVDRYQERAVVLMRPQVVDDPIGDLQRGFLEHPVVRHYRRSGSSCPTILSSCAMGRWRRWMDHPTYATSFRPLGTPHEIVIPVPWPSHPSSTAAYAVTRSGSDFDDRQLNAAFAAQRLLHVLHDSDPQIASTGRLDLLTAAERNVLALYGMRLTEAQIAENRGTKVATVHAQLRTGSAKLELHGRSRRRDVARIFGYLPPGPLAVDRLARILDG